MKKVILFLILFTQTLLYSQNVNYGLYVGKEVNEYICIKSDSIQFRLNTQGGLLIYAYAKGKYKLDNEGRYEVSQNTNELMEQTSIIAKYPRNDSLIVLSIIDIDSNPFIYTAIYFRDITNNKLGVEYTDINGQVILSGMLLNNYSIEFRRTFPFTKPYLDVRKLDRRYIGDYLGKEILIIVKSTTIDTKKSILFERGYDYVIQSTISNEFPITIFNTNNKLLIQPINDNEINVEIIWDELNSKTKKRKKTKDLNPNAKTTLYKVGTECDCSGFLFNEDFSNFYNLNINQ